MNIKEKINRKKEFEQKLLDYRKQLSAVEGRIEAYEKARDLTLETARYKFTTLEGNEADVETAKVLRTLAFQIHQYVIWDTHVKNGLLTEIHNILGPLANLMQTPASKH